MGLNVNISQSFLKGLIAQDSSAPSWLAKTVATVGLCTAQPTINPDYGIGSNKQYITYELQTTVTSGSYYANGYGREVIGSTSSTAWNKMIAPTEQSTGSGVWYTDNNDVMVLGENLGSSAWPEVHYFCLFNDYEDDTTKEYTDSSTGLRQSNGVMVFGLLKDSGGSASPVTVQSQTVPLFRIGNFKLTFSAS